MAHYIETSALAKLVVEERETAALHRWLAADPVLVSCDLIRTELARAIRRTAPDRMLQMRIVMEGVITFRLTQELFDEAGRLEPPALRSLDAIHLAAALSLGDDLESVVTYDERLAVDAQALGVKVSAPV